MTHLISAVLPGQPNPRGATWNGEGVNFSLFSAHAAKIELFLFDPAGRCELQRIELTEQTDRIWHCYLPEARPELIYAYRVHGPYAPERGHRFNAGLMEGASFASDAMGTPSVSSLFPSWSWSVIWTFATYHV